jgi:hypothetical protein
MPVTPSPDSVGCVIDFIRRQSDMAALVGGASPRVSTRLSGTLPAIRVTLVDGGPDTTGEFGGAHPTVQVECWANDPATADLMMRTFTAALPQVKGGTWGGVYVSGARVDLGPIMSDDPDTTAYRQLTDVILDVHNP